MKRADITTIDVLKACEIHEIGISPFMKLKLKFLKHPDKIIYSAMERDFERGFIDYGVSIRTSFITEKGINFLKNLKTS